MRRSKAVPLTLLAIAALAAVPAAGTRAMRSADPEHERAARGQPFSHLLRLSVFSPSLGR